jgi:hypothetical protein
MGDVEVHQIRVTDHALVRYLERTGTVKTDRVRIKMRKMVAEAVPFAKCDGLWHAATQLVFIVEGDTLVTVLGGPLAEKYFGRRLVDGTEATPVRAEIFNCPFCNEPTLSRTQLSGHILAQHSHALGPIVDASATADSPSSGVNSKDSNECSGVTVREAGE